MNEIWAQISGYVIPIISSLVSSGVIGTLIAFIAKKIMAKTEQKIENNVIAKDISKAVVDNITNKELKISLESFNKKQVNELKDDLTKQFKGAFESIEMQNNILAILAQIMSKFRAVTDEEKEALAAAISVLMGKKVELPKTEEPITITIDKIEDNNTTGGDTKEVNVLD